MATLAFAYTNKVGCEYDLKKAKNERVLTEFTLEVILGEATYIAAKPLSEELLDGTIWELPTKFRTHQSFTTAPTILLTKTSTGNRSVTTIQLLREWFFARSRWISTPDIADTYVKVVRSSSNDFSPELQSDLRFLQSVTIEFETAAPFSPTYAHEVSSTTASK